MNIEDKYRLTELFERAVNSSYYKGLNWGCHISEKNSTYGEAVDKSSKFAILDKMNFIKFLNSIKD